MDEFVTSMYIFVVDMPFTWFDKVQIDVVSVSRLRLPLHWKTDGTTDTYPRLWYAKSGHGTFWIGDVPFELRPGGVYLIPSYSRLRYQAKTPIDLSWAHFTTTILGGLDLFRYFNCRNELYPTDKRQIEQDFARLLKLFSSPSATTAFECDAVMRLLLVPFMSTVSAQQSGFHPDLLMRLQPILHQINQHLDETIRVSDLARQAHLEYSYFSRMFKKTFGISLSGYLMRCRIKKAQGLLLQPGAKLACIARQTGFSDELYLSKTFKKITGQTTTQFRENAHRNMP